MHIGELKSLSPFGKIVWEDRYALKDENGKLIEKNISETFLRVAKAIASKEKDVEYWGNKFYKIMANQLFCPAGRVLAHSGTHYSQFLNCFVLPFEDDSLEEIMNTGKNMAIVQKFGGGCIGGESLVLTDKGPIPLKVIVEGFDNYLRVLSYNSDTGETEYCDIMERHTNALSGDRVFEIEFDDMKGGVAARMHASDWHPFFVALDVGITQIRADELKPGMVVIGCPSGEVMGEGLPANAAYGQIVLSSKATGISETLYDLTIKKNQTFIASDPTTGAYVVVHNTGFNFSKLRPSGSYIKGVNGRSSGIIGFISMLSTISEVIEQGGCVTKDSLISTKSGLLYLEEIVKKPLIKGWHSHSLCVKTKDGDCKSSRYFVNGYKDTLKIVTERGTELTGTLSHKLYVFTEKGFDWKYFKDLKIGDYIVHKLKQHSGSMQNLDIEFSDSIHHNCIVPERLPSKIDGEFAFFMGYFLGNGFSSENEYKTGVSIPVRSYLNTCIEDIFHGLFGDNISVFSMKKPDDESTSYYVSNKLIYQFFKKNNLLKPKSLNASLPQKIRCSPIKVLGLFLSGLFEADGALRTHRPQLNTSSYKLAKEIHVLLFNLGIPSSIRSKVDGDGQSYSKNRKYSVRIVTYRGLIEWNKIVTPHIESRFRDCYNFNSKSSNEHVDLIPFSGYWLCDLLKKLVNTDFIDKKKKNLLLKELKRHIKRGRITLTAYLDLSEKCNSIEKLPLINNLFFSKVKEIHKSANNTYDIEVDVSGSYIANSLVSHNSRRGASLGLLEVRHPDIWEFISYKTEHNWECLREFMDVNDPDKWESFKYENLYKWQMFNVSVGITDEFLEAVKNNEEWCLYWGDEEWELRTVLFKKYIRGDNYKELKFEVTANCDQTAIWKVKKKIPYPTSSDIFEVVSKRRVRAPELWDRICYNAWADGCPGIINLTTARKMHNLEYVSPIEATNPCLHGDTLVAVADGRNAVSIKQLAEEDKDIPVYCRDDNGKVAIRMMRHPRITGYNKKIYKVVIEGNHELRVTENHKFILSDGTVKRARDLKYGDSFSIMNKLQAPFEAVLKHSNSKSKDYYWLNTTDKKSWIIDHRLIYEFNFPGELDGKVTHQEEGNCLNNFIENLRSYLKSDHDKLHAQDMVGDKNPMRRGQTEWFKEKWQQYSDNMSKAVSGERNGRYSGISNNKLFDIAVKLTKEYGRRVTSPEWQKFALKNKYPSQFSEFRTEVFGTVAEFLDKAAVEADVPGVGLKHIFLSNYRKFIKLKEESDLDIFFDEGIRVRKKCEACGKEFIVKYGRREQGYCSQVCCNQNSLTEEGREKIREAKAKIREDKRVQQVNVFNDLKLDLGRDPMKKEWASVCKSKEIPFRLPTKREIAEKGHIGTFCGYGELKKAASLYNHRVIRVEEDEFGAVYNGTVDEFHNFYIGHFEGLHEGHRNYSYINNLNCGEQALGSFGSCNLSSIILPNFVIKDSKTIDYEKLKEVIHTAVRFSDNVIDNCEFPIPEIKEKALQERRVGLGTMGVHDMLIEMELDYDSDEGRKLVEEVLVFMRDEAYQASIEIAKEKGSFPAYNKEKYLKSGFIQTLPQSIIEKIDKEGIRNPLLLSQAPTGSISALHNVSSGCEPWFSLSFQRNTRLGSYMDGCEAYIEWHRANPDLPIPSYFKTAPEISPEDHVKMLILFSKYIGSSVSKTVNLPNQATVQVIKDTFIYAMENGVKGLTVFRDGSKEGVLVNKETKKVDDKAIPIPIIEEKDCLENVMSPKKRGDKTMGATYRVHMHNHNLYVTVNRNLDGELVEIFTTVGESKKPNAHHTSGVEDSWAEGLGKIISLALRAGVKPASIIRNLKNIPSDKPVFTTIGDKDSSEHVPSPPHAIARVIEEELMGGEKRPHGNTHCSECSSTNVKEKSPTCYECIDCGYSGCS